MSHCNIVICSSGSDSRSYKMYLQISSFLCDDTVCKSTCAPLGCLAPDAKECEGVMLPLYTNPNDFCSCCLDSKKCITYLKEGDACELESTLLNPKKMCGPRLSKGTFINDVTQPGGIQFCDARYKGVSITDF